MEVLQAKTKASTDEGRPEAEEASTASHDCNAAGEWKKVCAAPSQDAPAKAGKKTSRKKKFDKNSPSAVTFRLVAASFADPATQQSSQNAQKMALQRVIPPNALKKNRFRDVLPNDLLRVLSPEHFGIHSNLDEENRRLLCDQVYGGDEELLQAAQEALAAKSKQSSSRAGERQQHQPTLDELDEDCYFPKDGYDYSQHLVSLGGGVLIERVETTAEKHRKAQKAKQGEVPMSKEERQVMEALENAADYEELLDDFVGTAREIDPAGGNQEDVDEDALLWGEENLESAQLYAIRERLAVMREQLHEGGEDDDEEDEEASDVFPALSSEKVEAVRPVTGAQQRELEKKFDRVFEEYNDEFIGELDAEEVEDDQDKLLMSELEDAMEEFLQDQARRRKVCVDSTSRKYRQRHPEEKKRDDSSDEQEAHRRVESEDDEKEDSNEIREIFKPLDSAEISRIQELAARQQAEDEEAEKDGGKKRQEFDFLDLNDYEKRAGERRWDCETVLTTKSVSSFVPTKIALPPTHILKHQVRQLREGKGANLQTLGLPRRDAPKPENTAEASLASGLSPLREGDGSEEEGAQAADDFVDLPHEGLNEACIVTLRPKGETPEERRERKKAVKEAQRMVRVVKKQNKQLRKEEEKKMAARNAKSNAYDVKDGVRRVRL